MLTPTWGPGTTTSGQRVALSTRCGVGPLATASRVSGWRQDETIVHVVRKGTLVGAAAGMTVPTMNRWGGKATDWG